MGPATEDPSDEPPMLVVDIRSLKAARSAPVLVVATENAASKEEAVLQPEAPQQETGRDASPLSPSSSTSERMVVVKLLRRDDEDAS